MKAIETRYAGCHFRSRIEARWAVFFDKLGLTWQYEMQGFQLPSGQYLPDFYLPEISAHDEKPGIWWEVKGAAPTQHEMNLAWELYLSTNKIVYVAHGEIPRDWEEPSRIQLAGGSRERFAFREGRVTLTPDLIFFDQDGVSDLNLADAYAAARSARFEHGWSGAS